MKRVFYLRAVTAPATPASWLAWRAGLSWHIRCMYYTYVLKSVKDEKLYIGFTDDLNKRFSEHNDGQVISTRDRRPFKLVYYEVCNNKYKALNREKYFKTGFGRKFLKDRI